MKRKAALRNMKIIKRDRESVILSEAIYYNQEPEIASIRNARR